MFQWAVVAIVSHYDLPLSLDSAFFLTYGRPVKKYTKEKINIL